jgi:hypothetical protein
MPIRETSLSFPVTRGSGPRLANSTIVFPRQVLRAVAALRGYQIGYVGDDHHVGVLQVELETTVNSNVVVVTGKLGCRDWSGNWDDEYTGAINVTVFAELDSPSAPPRRGDLQIVGLEVNQATQHFRSSEHLDSANVMPDNSMPLVGGKMTGLRFYIDYDAASGLPAVARLSGSLRIRSGGAETTLVPLAAITPRAEAEIDRAQAGHTLNFAVPGAWCRGQLEVSLEVFDQARPEQRSASFLRTLQFVEVNPLRIYGVGINYTGDGMNLPAPSFAALDATFDFTRKVWPTGEILSSGFTTLTFGQNLAGNAADGCGSGFSALLAALRDIKGDTDDLVYGVLPLGTPLTGVGGCGGGGAGTGMVGGGVTAAHEAGHAVGRQHAPCDDPARCDSPQNQDNRYPKYGNFVSDSIGEYGFDPAVNTVHNPAVMRDFMGYSGNDWISPYTYRALFAKGDPQPGSAFSTRHTSLFMNAAVVDSPKQAQEVRAEWIKRRIPLLFLSLWVDGDKVTLRPSFTYPAFIRRPGQNTPYEVHLVGAKDEVLACVTLQQACGACDQDCGPLQLQGEVPWDSSAKRLVLRRDHRDIESWPVEEPPKLKVEAGPRGSKGYTLRWSVADQSKLMHYLVQWRDIDGTWRGVAPRTTDTTMVIPTRYRFAERRVLKVRVLAVHMLHTYSEEIELQAEGKEPPVTIDVRHMPNEDIFRAVPRDALGRALPSQELVWYDEDGGEIIGGGDLPLWTTRRRGVATVRRQAGGVTTPEGFAVLDPKGDNDLPICGCRPSGRASADTVRSADFSSFEKD